MPGALINLIAVGVQDAYLTGNPTITFFKALYRRHTNFALEAIEQTFNGMVDFGRTNVSATVARNGDLISRIYIKAKVNIKQEGQGRCAFVRNLGHAMLSQYSILIGGAQIDKQCGEWMTIKNSLCLDAGQSAGYDRMVGNVPELTELRDRQSGDEYTIYVPLNFWFCNSYSQALPIIALQYHDVRIGVDFRDAASLVCKEGDCKVDIRMSDATLLIDYVLLDTQERKLFATQPHEMLIEQLQYPTSEPFNDVAKKFRLTLNHPCKHVTWAAKMNKFTSGSKFLAYHPTDMMYVKERAAKLLYLMSLMYSTGAEKTGTKYYNILLDPPGLTGASASVKITGSTVDKQRFFVNAWGNQKVRDFINGLKDKAMILNDFNDLADDEANPSATTLAGFELDPFSHIEFVDKSFLTSTLLDEIVSTPIDALFEGGFAKSSTLSGGVEWTNLSKVFSKFFVTVNMFDNFGTRIDGSVNPTDKAVIQINGQDRFSERDGSYFNYVQPFQHWPNTPADGINTYSFALKPSEYQPSGTLNFSRVDYATLNLTSKACEAKVSSGGASLSYYTVNYNILRVLGGMGGVAYSN
jgi:hypothetical protein